jgi:hypothetical protein
MKQFSKLLVALSILLGVSGACSIAEAQTGSLTDVVSCQETSLDLANMLVQVSRVSQMPIIAELAQPLPNVELSEGTYVVRDLMHAIVRQVPGYDWESKGKVLYVYNRQLKDAKFNFLAIEFPTFVIPPNISELNSHFLRWSWGS